MVVNFLDQGSNALATSLFAFLDGGKVFDIDKIIFLTVEINAVLE